MCLKVILISTCLVFLIYMHSINLSRTTVKHTCNRKDVQITNIRSISKGSLFWHTLYRKFLSLILIFRFRYFLTDKETGISKPMLVGIVFGELLLLLFIFDLVLYMKNWGLIHYLRKSVGKAVSRGEWIILMFFLFYKIYHSWICWMGIAITTLQQVW